MNMGAVKGTFIKYMYTVIIEVAVVRWGLGVVGKSKKKKKKNIK